MSNRRISKKTKNIYSNDEVRDAMSAGCRKAAKEFMEDTSFNVDLSKLHKKPIKNLFPEKKGILREK